MGNKWFYISIMLLFLSCERAQNRSQPDQLPKPSKQMSAEQFAKSLNPTRGVFAGSENIFDIQEYRERYSNIWPLGKDEERISGIWNPLVSDKESYSKVYQEVALYPNKLCIVSYSNTDSILKGEWALENGLVMFRPYVYGYHFTDGYKKKRYDADWIQLIRIEDVGSDGITTSPFKIVPIPAELMLLDSDLSHIEESASYKWLIGFDPTGGSPFGSISHWLDLYIEAGNPSVSQVYTDDEKYMYLW